MESGCDLAIASRFLVALLFVQCIDADLQSGKKKAKMETAVLCLGVKEPGAVVLRDVIR